MTAQPTFAHHALIYESADELMAAAVPFLTEGLEAGQEAILLCPPALARAIAAAVGRGGPMRAIDPEDVFTGSVRALAAIRRVALGHDGGGVRIVASAPLGRSLDGWQEWGRYEAAVNVALAPLHLSCICAYDGRDMPDPMRSIIGRTHPYLRTPGDVRANPDFLDPATFVRWTAAAAADPVEQAAPDIEIPAIVDVYDLAEARSAVRAALTRARVSGLIAADCTAAAGELLANAFQHGRPPVRLRLWIRPDRLVCTVHDHGPGVDDPLAGYVPPPDPGEHGGAGLWLARQTCDRLDMRHDGDGFTVRAMTLLDRQHIGVRAAAAKARAELAHRRAQAARLQAQKISDRLRRQQQEFALRNRRD